MATIDVKHWKAGVRNQSLRDLIAHHISRQASKTRLQGLEGTLDLLPEQVRMRIGELAAGFALVANAPEFWGLDCVSFYESVERGASKQFKEQGLTPDDEAIFNSFQVAVLRLAHEVESNSAVRAAAGIRPPFPWPSALLLLYPIIAYLIVRRSLGDSSATLGYSLSNLGYALLAAGVFAGSFKALGLRSRRTVVTAAIIAWVLGVVLSNLGS